MTHAAVLAPVPSVTAVTASPTAKPALSVLPSVRSSSGGAFPGSASVGLGGEPDLHRLLAPMAADLERVREVYDRELNTDITAVAEMVRHIGGFRGKMLRPALLLAVGRACASGQPLHTDHVLLAAVVEMVHVATLVHDDILDESRLRRNRATVNQRWGNESAVLLGDFLISHAYHLCSLTGDAEAARLVAATTNLVCEGELMQVSRRSNWALPETEYFEIIRRKTGVLLGLSARLGARASGAQADTVERLDRFGTEIGVAFQIVDDVLDLAGDPAEVGKSLGTDLVKGKMTLPMIRMLSAVGPAERAEWLSRLSSDPLVHVGELRRRLRETGALEAAYRTAELRVSRAVELLEVLPIGPARELLSAMAAFVVQRRR